MAFYAKSFVFDNVPSEVYDMRIFNFGTGGIENSPGGTGIEIINKSIYRKPKPYFFGVSQRPVLEFPLTFGSYSVLCGRDRSDIQRWLFGNSSYKRLSIAQDDISEVHYNVLLTNPQPAYIGNLNYAFTCTASCDSPWGWESLRTLTQTYTGGGITNTTFNIYNQSDNNDYTYPSVTFITNGIGTYLTLINNTDNSRSFQFSDISALETITVDNDRQIVTSSTGLLRLQKFNLKWFRLLPGNNSISVQGGISSLSISYNPARKIGG
jgi:phage-related protein